MFEIPRYLIYQKTMPGGVRLPKRKRIEAQAQRVLPGLPPIVKGMGYTTSSLVSSAPESLMAKARERMGFTYEEFRFFCLCEDAKQAVCRCCGAVFSMEAPRRYHLKDKGCSVATIGAYKLLLRDQKCVVCDRQTNNERWGVPLCKGTCTHGYMFATPTPDALWHAFHVY